MANAFLPWEFDPEAYRARLTGFEEAAVDDLVEHYIEVGKAFGLPGNGILHRHEFLQLVPQDTLALEIGPFASPAITGPHMRYCDVLDTAQLRQRAPNHLMDPEGVPHIDYVMQDCSLDGIPVRFDTILSSHAIEHQPDLVAHLQQIERRLTDDGRYFVVVPDKRFCFDRNLAPSTIAEVLQAHRELRKVHTLRSVIEHRAFMTHNDPTRHWLEGEPPIDDGRQVDEARVAAAVREYEEAAGGYIDVHAWYFTPHSFRHLMRLLRELGLTRLHVQRLYATRRGGIEFYAVLGTQACEPGPFDEITAAEAPASAPPARATPPDATTAPAARSLLGRTLQSLLRGR
jgi:SAM-dependent methyltransferase